MCVTVLPQTVAGISYSEWRFRDMGSFHLKTLSCHFRLGQNCGDRQGKATCRGGVPATSVLKAGLWLAVGFMLSGDGLVCTEGAACQLGSVSFRRREGVGFAGALGADWCAGRCGSSQDLTPVTGTAASPGRASKGRHTCTRFILPRSDLAPGAIYGFGATSRG